MRFGFLLVLVLMSVIPGVAFAAWGVSGTGGYWQMDARDFERYAEYRKAYAPEIFGSKITRGSISREVSVFYETSSAKKLNYGISFGYGAAPMVNYLRFQGISGVYETYYTDENKTTTIPVFLYLKWGPKEAIYSFFGGIGAEYFMARTRTKGYSVDYVSPSYSNSCDITFKKNQVVPGVVAGGEYFLFKNLSLGLSLKYLFSGEVKDLRGEKDGVEWRMIMTRDAATNTEYLNAVGIKYELQAKDRLFRYDYTGLRANFTAKLYFGR